MDNTELLRLLFIDVMKLNERFRDNLYKNQKINLLERFISDKQPLTTTMDIFIEEYKTLLTCLLGGFSPPPIYYETDIYVWYQHSKQLLISIGTLLQNEKNR